MLDVSGAGAVQEPEGQAEGLVGQGAGAAALAAALLPVGLCGALARLVAAGPVGCAVAAAGRRGGLAVLRFDLFGIGCRGAGEGGAWAGGRLTQEQQLGARLDNPEQCCSGLRGNSSSEAAGAKRTASICQKKSEQQ